MQRDQTRNALFDVEMLFGLIDEYHRLYASGRYCSMCSLTACRVCDWNASFVSCTQYDWMIWSLTAQQHSPNVSEYSAILAMTNNKQQGLYHLFFFLFVWMLFFFLFFKKYLFYIFCLRVSMTRLQVAVVVVKVLLINILVRFCFSLFQNNITSKVVQLFELKNANTFSRNDDDDKHMRMLSQTNIDAR